MSTHTPAPWRVIETSLLPHEGDHVADMSNGLMVVPFCRLGDPLSDARLIAAAPELYEALARLLQHCPTYSEFDDPEEHLYGAALERARAAIAAATGEQA